MGRGADGMEQAALLHQVFCAGKAPPPRAGRRNIHRRAGRFFLRTGPWAAPRRAVVWMSCPQACILPSYTEASGRCTASCWGMASMSARRATAGPGPPARRATAPGFGAYGQNLDAGRARRVSRIFCVVRVSSKLSSGWLCRSAAMGAQPRAEVLFAKRRCNRQESSLLFSGMHRCGCGSPVQTVTIVRALRPFCKALQAEKRQIPAEFLDKKRPAYL